MYEDHRLSRGAGGFSLIEMLIAMAVGMVILAAVYGTFTLQNKAFNNQEDLVELQQSVRAGMDMMLREVGLAGYDPRRVNADANPGNNFSGVTVNASQLQIQADLDISGTINPNSEENIIYTFDAADNMIRRNSGSGNQPFIENVQSFSFAYLNGNGNVTTDPLSVRRIRITITGKTPKPDPTYPVNGGYRTYTLESIVAPRNLDYDNL